jgi:hypothetical protein
MNKKQVLDEIAKNYNSIPDKYKPNIMNYFAQMPMSVRFDVYLSGSDYLRKFMDSQQFMSNAELYQYLSNHPAELKKAPDNVIEMFNEYKQEDEKS